MTPDDIAWVQGRLRDCKYLIATLHKCAQCLGVDDDELLAALGFANEAALKAAYPSKLRGRGGAHRGNTYTMPDENTMHEAVLMFYGGVDMDVVKRLIPNKAGTYGGQPVQPSGEEVLIDVSHHQGAIDWAKVPYRAIVRIGYRGYGSGKLMKDEQYDANLAGAKASGKLFGFYFFSQAITVDEAREEADFCASLAPSGYPLFLDAEWSHATHDGRADNLTKDQRTAIAMAFCERAKAHGFTAGIYTFTSFATANIDYEGLCKDYIGWLADTRANYDTSLPRYIHQYSQTAKGGVPGIGPETDLNRIVKALPAVDKPERKLQVITIGPVTQGDADAIYLLCKARGLTDAGLYKSEWA